MMLILKRVCMSFFCFMFAVTSSMTEVSCSERQVSYSVAQQTITAFNKPSDVLVGLVQAAEQKARVAGRKELHKKGMRVFKNTGAVVSVLLAGMWMIGAIYETSSMDTGSVFSAFFNYLQGMGRTPHIITALVLIALAGFSIGYLLESAVEPKEQTRPGKIKQKNLNESRLLQAEKIIQAA